MASFKNTQAFDPRSISGCALWLDAADSSTMTFSSGSNLQTWRNKGNQGGIFTQGGTASRLTYASSNNYKIVNFDSDGSSLNAWMTGTLPFTATTSFFQVITPIAYTPGTWSFHWSWQWASAGNRVPGFRSLNSSRAFEPYITWVGNNNNSIPVVNGRSYLSFVEFTGGGANTRYSISGNSPRSGTISASNINSSVFILGGDGNNGATVWGKTYVSEIIMFSNVLTTSQRQQVEGYLAWKWGLSGSLPDSHPLKQPIVPFSFPLQRTNTRVTQTFDPRSLSGCQLWLDAADTTTLSLSGSAVTGWRDKSGNARNFIATQGNFTSILDGTRRVVNIPNTTYMTCVVPLTVTANVSWLFVVAKLGRTTDPPMYLMNFTPDGDEAFRYHYNTGSYGGAPGAPGDGNELLTPGQSYIHGVLNTATTYTNYHQINGPIQNTRTTTSITLSSPFGSRYFLGTLAELILFSGPITRAQREQVEGYLARKWGISTSLPTSHPNANPLTIAPFPYQNTPVPMKSTGRWLPIQLSGCTLWLDAFDTSSIIQSGGKVSQWNDKSGNSYHATQTTGANQPTYIKSTVKCLSASQHWMNLSQTYGNLFLNNKPFHVFIVALGSGSGFITGQVGNTSQNLFLGYGFMDTYQSPWYLQGSPPVADTLNSINQFEYTGTGAALYQNGQSYASKSGTLPLVSFSGPQIGRRYSGGAVAYHDHTFSEIISFHRNLSIQERQQVEGYLAWKWGLQRSLSSTHPYANFPPLP